MSCTVIIIIAERREHSKRSKANNRCLFKIPQYLYIYCIYMYICLYIFVYILHILYILYMSVCSCIAQDRAHLMQVLSRRPIVHCAFDTGCCSEHHFEESPFQ